MKVFRCPPLRSLRGDYNEKKKGEIEGITMRRREEK
jgi:hypothetical protein